MVSHGDAPEAPSDLWPSEQLLSDAVGRLMEFWGFKRHMGRIWAVLYLSDEPLAALSRSLVRLSQPTRWIFVNNSPEQPPGFPPDGLQPLVLEPGKNLGF